MSRRKCLSTGTLVVAFTLLYYHSSQSLPETGSTRERPLQHAAWESAPGGIIAKRHTPLANKQRTPPAGAALQKPPPPPLTPRPKPTKVSRGPECSASECCRPCVVSRAPHAKCFGAARGNAFLSGCVKTSADGVSCEAAGSLEQALAACVADGMCGGVTQAPAVPVKQKTGGPQKWVFHLRKGMKAMPGGVTERSWVYLAGSNCRKSGGAAVAAAAAVKVAAKPIGPVDTSARGGEEAGWPALFISIKSSARFHRSRLLPQLRTWVAANAFARSVTYFYTDAKVSASSSGPSDAKILSLLQSPAHIVNTGCPPTHARLDLCCKTQSEIAGFVEWDLAREEAAARGERSKTQRSFWCHFDDDQYVLPRNLAKYLAGAPSTRGGAFYGGKPGPASLGPFAMGGGGYCIDGATAQRAHEYGFVKMCEETRMPDDVTMGSLMAKFKVPLTTVELFHSQFESWGVSASALKESIADIGAQVSLGWDERNAKDESMDALHELVTGR